MSAPPSMRLAALAVTMSIVFTVLAPAGVGVAAAGNTQSTGAGNQSLGVGVQQGAGGVTVSVSQNGSASENATVRVAAKTTYAGTGEYLTDAAGTVSLPVPNETVRVSISAEVGEQTGSTNATLHANAGQGPSFVPMGQRIAAFVHGLQQSGGVVKIGPAMADYVTALAPAGGPPTTGPPPWVGDVADRAGPPAQAGSDARSGDRGPPDHAGPVGETDTATGSAAGPTGPPAHAGPPDEAGTNDAERDAANAANETDGERENSPENEQARGSSENTDEDEDDADTDENSGRENAGKDRLLIAAGATPADH